MSDQVISRDIAAPEPRLRQRRSPKRLGLAGLGALAVIGAGAFGYDWWTTGRFMETTDDAYVGANVTPIAPHIAGFVQQILVTDNQYVDAGQPLLRIDPSDYAAAVGHARAELRAKQGNVDNLEAKRRLQLSLIGGAEADLAARQAQAAFAAQDAERYRSLAMTAAGSRQDDQRAVAGDRAAKAAVLSAQAALGAAGQQLGVLDTELVIAKANVTQAEADLRMAELNLGYTVITAPIAGYVGNRSAQVGSYVAAGTNLLSVVPAHGLWVDANFKEDQIAQMKPGSPATIVADVLPGRSFHGQVISMAPATGAVFSVIPPQNATGNFTKIVQRVPVRILLDADGQDLGLLRAGLSTYVRVNTRPAEANAK
ncbi:MAG: HlyD family secretion protein [Rhodopila sp.]